MYKDIKLVKSDGSTHDWPDCLYLLTDGKKITLTDLPELVKIIFDKFGVPEKERYLPLTFVIYLGTCTTDLYFECSQLPEHRLNKHLESDGKYYWFDLNLKDAAGCVFPLRLVINTGNADSNDGYWGTYFHRETHEALAKLESTGDRETILTVISEKINNSYKPYNIQIPDIPDQYEAKISSVKYTNNPELEQNPALGLNLKILITVNHNHGKWYGISVKFMQFLN